MAKKSLKRVLKDGGLTNMNDPLTQLALKELAAIHKEEKNDRAIQKRLDAQDKQLAKQMKNRPDTCWDDLNDIYNHYVALFKGYAFMGKAMNNKELLAKVANKKAFTDNVKLLHHDLQSLRAELEQIHAMHAGRTGGKAKGTAGDKELIAVIEVAEHYQVWLVKHDQLTDRTSVQIRAAIQDAEARLLAEQEANKPAEEAVAEAPAETVAETDTTATTTA